jgi:hypothetical protein
MTEQRIGVAGVWGFGMVLALAFALTAPERAAAADQTQFTAIETAIDSAIGAFTAASSSLGSKSNGFVKNLNSAESLVVNAATSDASGNKKKASSSLRKAGKKVNSIAFRLRSLQGRKKITDPPRTALLNQVNAIEADIGKLRKNL